MDPEIRALALTQLGVVTRRQALELGMTERRLKTALLPGGPWVVIRRGVYAERWVWESADEARRHLMRVRAATLVATTTYAVSHSSAAVVHGLDMRAHTREVIHVSHPRVLGGRTEGGVSITRPPCPSGRSWIARACP